MIITTSWDDGDRDDMKMADLLDRFHVRGTFYIARHYRKKRLSASQIHTLSRRHEIGAHTLTHPDLTQLSRTQLIEEIAGSKRWLEDIIGKEVTMFCYPGGKYNDAVVQVVRESGFRGARTTDRGILSFVQDTYRLGISMTAYPHLDMVDPVRSILARAGKWLPNACTDRAYPKLEGRLRERALEAREKGTIFHLYGHSWANSRYNLWPALDRFLKAMADLSDCTYVTNSELLDQLSISPQHEPPQAT